MTNLKERTISGLKWSTISLIGRQGTQFITGIFLARILLPSDFGLLGMAMVAIGFVNVFRDLGTSAAIIQRKEISEQLLSSLFWINFSFGILVTLILFFLSPFFGVLFHDSRVSPIIQVLSISFVITSLSTIHKALFEREINFRQIAITEISSSIVGSIVGIGLALYQFGVWSLVYQTIASVITSTIFFWTLSTLRIRFVFKLFELRKVGHFSLNLIGFNLLNYFSRSADNILIGRFLGAQSLGYYSVGYNLLLVSTNLITGIINRVIFPVYSLLQDENKRFADTYLEICKNLAFISFPIMAGEFALAEPLVLALYGEKWLPVIPLVMVLAPVGLIQSIGATVGSIYQAKGKTDLMFKWGIFSSFIVVSGFFIGLNWGVIGVAASYLITTYLLAYPSFVIPFKLIDLNFSRFAKSIEKPLMNSLIMVVFILFCRSIVKTEIPITFDLLIFGFLGVTIYIVASWFTNRAQTITFFEMVLPKASNRE